jgi:hypothetical protein
VPTRGVRVEVKTEDDWYGIHQFFTKFLLKNPANFLIALLSGILPLAYPVTKQDIPDNSGAI